MYNAAVIYLVVAPEGLRPRRQRVLGEERWIDSQQVFAGRHHDVPPVGRDEEIFDDPFSFQIDRIPNRHLGFGVGEHFCLGAHLARLEMSVAYKYLLPRIEEIVLTGPVERLHSALVGGVKKLPIRYKLRPE